VYVAVFVIVAYLENDSFVRNVLPSDFALKWERVLQILSGV
jgi:hypothetical protein